TEEVEDHTHIAARDAGVDGCVVLVNKDDDLLTVDPVEVAGEIEERVGIDGELRGAVEHLAIAPYLFLGEPAAVEQRAVLREQPGEPLADHVPGEIERLELDAFER